MIELKGLCKSFEEKEVLKDQSYYWPERFRKNRTDEMYRRPADTRKR